MAGRLSPEEQERLTNLLDAAKSETTRKAYERDLSDWGAFAEARGAPVFPVSEKDLLAYILHMARKKPPLKISTVRRRMAAISALHRRGAVFSPTKLPSVHAALEGYARTHRAPVTKKKALTTHLVKEIVDLPDIGPMERALFLVGLVSSMRRSELTGLRWEHVEETPAGVLLRVEVSKTNQRGDKDEVKSLPFKVGGKYNAAWALMMWRDKSEEDRVFPVHPSTLARMVKRRVAQVGEDPDLYSGHSFRSGFVTEALGRGATAEETMEQTGHVRADQTRSYGQAQRRLTNPAVLKVQEGFEDDE